MALPSLSAPPPQRPASDYVDVISSIIIDRLAHPARVTILITPSWPLTEEDGVTQQTGLTGDPLHEPSDLPGWGIVLQASPEGIQRLGATMHSIRMRIRGTGDVSIDAGMTAEAEDLVNELVDWWNAQPTEGEGARSLDLLQDTLGVQIIGTHPFR